MAEEPETVVDGPIERVGARIGRYKLLQFIAEGGMGSVWMAEQQEPVRRRVALKIIKLGMDTKQVIGRFEAERQALALMDHPNITKVIDAGSTNTGRPYFVMELVKGVPITQYCDDHKLSTEERLNLFIDVCKAIQHAHQKGIIHRDIKASNILVTLNDGVPVPKVIDFGIVKAIGGQVLTDKTVFTAFEQFIGTPAYMSPEQAEFSALDIDTRSDIYALGVLLYELLTGMTPFDAKELIAKGVDEVRRIIREEEPPRPSTRLGTLAEAKQTDVAKKHHSEVPRLIDLIRGDLDWIVMKALEKDRSRRYETANGLALDVERYLHDEPVGARPPSASYRTSKFLRKHRAAVVVAAVILLLVLGGGIATSVLYMRARVATQIAKASEQDAMSARSAAEEAAAVAQESQALAEASRREAERRAYVLQLSRVGAIWRDSPGAALTLLEDEEICKPDLRCFAWRLMYRLLSPQTLSIETGASRVARLAFSPNGQHLAATDYSGLVSVWDVEDGSLVWFAGNSGENVDFSADGRNLVTIDGSRVISIRDAENGQTIRELTPGVKRVHVVRFGPRTRRIAFASDHRIHLWSPVTDEIFTFTDRQEAGVSDLAFSPDEKYLVSASWHDLSTLWVWDLEAQQLSHQLTGQLRPHHIVFSPVADPPILASAGFDWRIRLWDVIERRSFCVIDTSETQVLNLSFSPDGKRLAFSNCDGLLQSYQLSGGAGLSTIGWHRTSLGYGVAYSPRGDKVAAGDDAGMIKVWPADRLDQERNIAAHKGEGWALEWTSGGEDLYTVGNQPGVQCWRTSDWQSRALNHFKKNETVRCVALSPDGKLIAAANQDREGSVRVWERSTGSELARIKHPGGEVWAITFSPDSRVLAVGGEGREIGFYETTGWQLSRTLDKPFHEVRAVAFSPDGSRFFAGGLAGEEPAMAFLWSLDPDIDSSTQLRGHHNIVTCALFTDDGSTLVTGSHDQTIIVWDVNTAKVLRRLRGHPGSVVAIALSKDGRTLASASMDRTVRLWDLESALPLITLEGHGNEVRDVKFDPSGERLASIDWDGRVLIWGTAPPTSKTVTLAEANAARWRFAGDNFDTESDDLSSWVEHFVDSIELAGRGDVSNALRMLPSGLDDTVRGSALSRLGDRLGMFRHWGEAASALVEATRVDPTQYRPWMLSCYALHEAAKTEELALQAGGMLHRFAETERVDIAAQVAKVFLVFPELLLPEDAESVSRLVAVASDPTRRPDLGWAWGDFLAGLAFYREGRWEAAERKLVAAVDASSWDYCTMDASILLAMCQHRQGKVEEAAATFHKAHGMAIPLDLDSNTQITDWGVWDDWTVARRLLLEAAPLFGGTNSRSTTTPIRPARQ